MKIRRSARLVHMTNYLLQHPHQLISLTYFSEHYESAKSSISEDLAIIKSTFETSGIGTLLTVAGAAGGVKYIPLVDEAQAVQFADKLCEQLQNTDRLLPGGYLYMTDLLGNPSIVNEIGRLFASVFANKQVDVIMTVATKGIPLAYAVASYLDVPVVIVRRDNKVTEGSTVSINYVSGSSKRIQTMYLSKRSLKERSRVLIIDDFMKAGGTINGMLDLIREFQSEIAGIGVLVESEDRNETLVTDYVSLFQLVNVDEKNRTIAIDKSNFFPLLAEAQNYYTNN